MANEHNTISWESHTLTTSDGVDHNILAGTTTDDITGRLAFDGTTPLLYYIYWYESEPTEYGTILASAWGDIPRLGYHIISEVMPQVSTLSGPSATPQANITHTVSTPMLTQVNISQVGVQDSITAATISNIGTTATLGTRMKFNTPGADIGGGGGGVDATRHWIRGYTNQSSSDTGGRWLDIDGYNQYIAIRDGASTDLLLAKMDSAGFSTYDGSGSSYLLARFGNGSGLSNGAGLRFFKGTSATPSDATTLTHFHKDGIRFYNSGGASSVSALTNIMMDLKYNSITFYNTSGNIQLDIQNDNIRFHNNSGNIVMRTSADGVTFYNATIATPDVTDTLAEISATTMTFYNTSGKADANRLVSIGNTGDGMNGIVLWGRGNSPNSTTPQLRFILSGDPDTTLSYMYSSTASFTGGGTVNSAHMHWYVPQALVLDSTSDTILFGSGGAYSGSAASGSPVKLLSGTAVSTGIRGAGLEVRMFEASNATNDPAYLGLYPVTAMNGSDATDATRRNAPWVNIGFVPDVDTGYNHRPINAISTYFNYAASSGTYSNPNYSWWGDPDTGMYRTGADSIGFSAGNALRVSMSGNGLYIYTISVESAVEVNINGSNKIVKVSSSRRYKDNIADLDINTEKIYDLRPVSFDWKSNGTSDFGFIAEEVHDILPELVVYNEDNTPEAVKYKQLSVLMLEELKTLREEVKDLKEKL